ncbi:MAG: shikimate dehydrogenase [Syntrophobacteraceae bacterium]|nr:shikimate dehydrogenase [Syntrophobacteraceae bacterium]
MIQPVQSKLLAVIGHPVAHSLSPLMMNAVFTSLNVPAVYVALDVDDLEKDLQTLAAVGFHGLSVTIPHKEAALGLVSEVDETASAIGAVNTLRLGDGGWQGRNTDWIGAVEALKCGAPLHSRKALVIGAGGAARAVVYGLKREGALVTVTNRTRERGEALAESFGCDFVLMETLSEPLDQTGYEIVVQCTSVGLEGREPILPVSDSLLRPGMVVMDIVYRPAWTPLLHRAAQKGCRVVKGHEMLLHQGIAQLEWWLEQSLPRAEGVQIMRNALEKALSNEAGH